MLETKNLKLKKPEDNDILDPSLSINPNMDIIDNEIGKIKEDIKNISSDAAGTSYDNTNSKLTSTNAQGAIDEVNAKAEQNKTSISALEKKTDSTNTNLSTLKTKVDAGQNFNLTQDSGAYNTSTGINIDNLTAGWHNIFQATGTLPDGFTADNNVIVEIKGTDVNWLREILYVVRSSESFDRNKLSGVWQPWRSL